MKQILAQLYYGEIHPVHHHREMLENFQKKCEAHIKRYDDFTEQLNQIKPELGARFLEIMEESCNNVQLDYSAAFIDGFQLGARIILGICQDS